MELEVAAAIRPHDYHPGILGKGLVQLRRGGGSRGGEAEQLAGGRRVEAARRAKESFELALRHGLSLGQEVEDAAARVVDHDQPQLGRVPNRRQAAQIVEESQIPEHRPGPGTAAR